MRTSLKIGLAAIALAIGCMPEIVLGQTTSLPIDRRVGCVYGDPGNKQFIDAMHRSQDQMTADVDAARQAGKPINACLKGKLRNLPAGAYAALVSRFPDKYKPLAPLPKSATVPNPGFLANNPTLQWSFVDLDSLVPAPFVPFIGPAGITREGRVVGSIYDVDFHPFLAAVENGQLQILGQGYANTTSASGIIGGGVLIDPVNFFFQAALFRGNDVTLIPPLPGEVNAVVMQVNDAGLAIVASQDANDNETWSVFKDGKREVIDFGLDAFYSDITGLNKFGVASGNTDLRGPPDSLRALRYDTNTKKTTVLEPLSDRFSGAAGINDQGEIVGWSYGPGIERVGVWHQSNKFEVYFVEGTPDVPTTSNRLGINNRNLIVISAVFPPTAPQEVGKVYIVPRKGLRLDLMDQLSGVPSSVSALGWIFGLNDRGQMTGTPLDGPDYLLTPKAPLGVGP